jgi:glyoxylase-like metal-dependent hydrolase (beta-lactamase superfamily II)
MPPVSVEHELLDGDELSFVEDLRAVHVPGHCGGHLAYFWPRHGGLLFAGDAAMNMRGLGLSLGYEDLELGMRSLRKLSRLQFHAACFGHGAPILSDASQRFREKWGSQP